MPRPLSMHGATSDFTAYGVKISLLKAFESFQMVLMKFFNLLNALKVRFKTAWQTCVMKGGIWSWRGASGPSTRWPGGGGGFGGGIWSCYTCMVHNQKSANFYVSRPTERPNTYFRVSVLFCSTNQSWPPVAKQTKTRSVYCFKPSHVKRGRKLKGDKIFSVKL